MCLPRHTCGDQMITWYKFIPSWHHARSDNRTQVIWLGCKYLYPLSPLRGPRRHFIDRLVFKAWKKNSVCLSYSLFAMLKYHEKHNLRRKGWFCISVPESYCPSYQTSHIRIQGKHGSMRSLVDQWMHRHTGKESGGIEPAHKASLLIPSFL